MNNKGYRRILIIGSLLILAASVLSFIASGWICTVIVLITCASILAVFVYYTGERYRQIEAINSYLSKVLSGDYELNINNNEEGELSILENNIYKATVLLRDKNEQLRSEKSHLTDMLTNISHQLKTPLTSVMMMTELISKEPSEEKRREFLTIEQAQIDKMDWLIKTLLKLSKLDAGTISLKSNEVRVNDLIDESLAPFMIPLDLFDITLTKNIDIGCVRIDKDWTVEAIGNIIKNCIEHINKGGHLHIESHDNSLYHVIFIKDDGLGISKDDLSHIFERFYRGKDSKKDSVGIGLALSESIIKNENGEIYVTSTVGKGTCFEIKFYKSVI